jgi:hypothetical protein
MIRLNRVVCRTLLFVVAAAGQAHAQSAGNSDAEIAALKQQLRLMEQKLDKLQKQTTANAEAIQLLPKREVTEFALCPPVPRGSPGIRTSPPYGIRTNEPIVFRVSRSVCAARASASRYKVGGSATIVPSRRAAKRRSVCVLSSASVSQ